MSGQVREKLADRDAALAVLLEFERRAQQVAGLARNDARLGERQGLAVVAIEERLVIEGVDLRGAAMHEQEDDALGPRGKMRRARGQRISWIGT